MLSPRSSTKSPAGYLTSFIDAASTPGALEPGFYNFTATKTPPDGGTEMLLDGKPQQGFWATAKQKAAKLAHHSKKLQQAAVKAKNAALQALKIKAKRVVEHFIARLPAAEPMLAHSSMKMPRSSTLLEMANMSYKSHEDRSAVSIGGKLYDIIFKTPTLTVFKIDDFWSKIVVVAVRGTQPKSRNDVLADVMIPSCKLHMSTRFKIDWEALQGFRERNEGHLREFAWIGTGHSLGGAIIDEFLKLKIIEQAVTFNPAVCSDFYHSQTNKRIYMSKDPLYLAMGRFTTNKVVIVLPREDDVGVMGAHFLINFNNRMSSSPVEKWFKEESERL